MDPNPKPVEDAKPEPVDLAKVRATLGLPETATEAETVGALLEVVAVLQAKYDALLGDSAEMEKTVANRDLDAFAEVITPETREYWAGQMLANRDATTAVLTGLKARLKPDETPPKTESAPAPRIPLANRVVPGTKPVTEVIAETGADKDTPDRAAKIRNRAQEIRVATGLPYIIAFERAEREFPVK